MTIKRIAIHEAGHAVACFVQKLPVERISLLRGQGGALWGRQRGGSAGRVKVLVRVCLAGLAAEDIAFEDGAASGHAQDMADAGALLAGLSSNAAQRDQLLRVLYGETVNLLTVAPHWRAVEVLAAALMERETLSGEDALGLLVDAQQGEDAATSDALQEKLLAVRARLQLSQACG